MSRKSVTEFRKVGFFLMFLVLICDQLTKHIVLDWATPRGFWSSDYLNIVCVLNKGVSFGFLNDGHMWQVVLIWGAVILFSIWLFFQYWNASSKFLSACYGMIIGGALGNSIDRFAYGAVIDFLDFHIDSIRLYPFSFHLHNWHWPAFNVADSMIVLGVVLLVCYHIREGIRK